MIRQLLLLLALLCLATAPLQAGDRDGDGVDDSVDKFPDNPYESSDQDNDGTGDNSDRDRDGDGSTNEYERNAGTNPDDPNSDPSEIDLEFLPSVPFVGGGWRNYFGRVVAEGLVLSDAGNPVWAEFDEGGEVSSVIGEASGEYANAQVVPGSSYSVAYSQYQTLVNDQGFNVLSADAYTAKQFKTLPNGEGEQLTVNKPSLARATVLVVVSKDDSILHVDQDIVQFESPWDFRQIGSVSSDKQSLLITQDGSKLLKASNHRIGYRSAIFSRADADFVNDSSNDRQGLLFTEFEEGDKLWGPMPGVKVENSMAFNRPTYTNANGKFASRYYVSICPGFFYEFEFDLTAELRYKSFNPKNKSGRGIYYTSYKIYDTCIGYGYGPMPTSLIGLSVMLNVRAIVATMSVPIRRANIVVAARMLAGGGRMENRLPPRAGVWHDPNLNRHVPLATDDSANGSTEYSVTAKTDDPIGSYTFDINEDDVQDTLRFGKLLEDDTAHEGEQHYESLTQEQAKTDPKAKVLVYFDPPTEIDGHLPRPDLVRQADKLTQLQDQGLLQAIHPDDLADTDIFVYRASTNQLITALERLNADYAGSYGSGGVDTDNTASAEFHYQTIVRGKRFYDLLSGGLNTWTAENQVNPEIYGKDKRYGLQGDLLRAGEQIDVYAINRKTGYIGRTQFEFGGIDGAFGQSIQPIVLSPPNLRIQAERLSSDDIALSRGPTKDLDESYLIGFEGSGLTSDQYIKITTEWLGIDGQPLPADLPGYTGRLAKVIDGNYTLAGHGTGGTDQVGHFAIQPGVQTQIVVLPQAQIDNQHFYVHVSGEASENNPSFVSLEGSASYDAAGGDNELLKYRPEYYVPVLVPVHDELASTQQLANAKTVNSSNVDLRQFEHTYSWVYRPEYQFSLFDLTVEAINRIADDENGNQQTQDIWDLAQNQNYTPTVGTGDDLLEVLFQLTGTEVDPLPRFSGERELILAVGEEEHVVTVNEDGQIQFEFLEHLASLNPIDFLTISLYQNNDSANVLWEFGFEYLDYYALIDDDVLPSEVDDAIEISADEPVVDLLANLVGFANRSESSKYDVVVIWELDGAGSLEKNKDSDDDYAIFRNTLTLPPVSGLTSTVTARLATTGTGSYRAYPLKFRVVPGKPTSVVTEVANSKSGVYVGRNGEVEVTATVRDDHGNLVADGTGVSVTTGGSLRLEEIPDVILDGEFSFSASGTDYPDLSNLGLRVGDVTDEVAVDVRPVEIEFEGLSESIDVNGHRSFSVSVTAGDEPLSGYEFNVWAENGRVANTTGVTGDDGRAEFTLFAPQSEETITVKAMTAMQKPIEIEVQARFPNADKPKIDSSRAKMVGNASQEAAFNYTRWDNTQFSVNKAIEGSVDVYGEQGETVSVSIGDAFSPNRLTQAAYWMNDSAVIAKDEVGFSNGLFENVSLNNSTLAGAGKSVSITQALGPSRIKVPNASRIQQTDDLSFSIEIRPFDKTGQIINLGEGLLLEMLPSGSLKLSARTQSGTYSVSQTELLPLNQWHKVAGSFQNGLLKLAVNKERYQTAVDGELLYSKIALYYEEPELLVEEHDLVIGQGYHGLVNCLKWFNLASQPLATFADGSERSDVEIGESGVVRVAINSNGGMQSFASELPVQSIALTAGDTRQTLDLLSSETFESLARATLSTGLVANTSDFNLAALNQSRPVAGHGVPGWMNNPALFPAAQAYDIGFWDVVSIVKSLIGLDSLEVIWEQVGNMFSGREVDIVAFSVALLDVLSLFPPAAPLKVLTVPAKTAIKLLKLGNTKAVKYLGGVMKRMFDKAKDRDFSLIFQGIAFFIIIADMASDPESRAGITELAKMINSTDDLLDIMDYFSLADDELDIDENALLRLQNLPENSRLAEAVSVLFPAAYAKVPAGKGKQVGKALADLAPVLAKLGPQAPKMLGALGRTGTKIALKNKRAATRFKNAAFTKGFLSGAAGITNRLGVTKMRQLMLSEHRMGPITLVAVVAYLESELEAKRLFSGLEAADVAHNIEELRGLYVKAIPGIAAGSKNYNNFVINAHGAQFHLLQIAILHALSETGGEAAASSKVVGIEVPREVSIFVKGEDLGELKSASAYDPNIVKDFNRNIDIVTGSLRTGEIWREMKSYKSNGKTGTGLSGGIKPWRWATRASDKEETNDQKLDGRTRTPHRQYTLDRIASGTSGLGARSKRARTYDITVKEMYWHFHKFQLKSSRSPKVESLQNGFNKEPVNKPKFYGDREFYAAYDKDVFVLGSIDLLLTNIKSDLEAVVRAEVAEKLGTD